MYKLTCREHPRGRGLIDVKPVDGVSDPARAGLDRWVLFVHGYNNDEEDAAKAWSQTFATLADYGVDSQGAVLFFWPGDYSRFEVVAAMSYPKVVPIAEATARRLAAYLTSVSQHRTLRLSLIAHSLGSLVTLETLRLLRDEHANVIIEDVLLMAAAVPVGFCVQGESYGSAYSATTRETALYSLDDSVLKKFFQAGQEVADRFPERRRRAVGRTGGPDAGPGGRWYSVAEMDEFDHGHYWRKPESIEKIAAILDPRRRETSFSMTRSRLRKDSLPTASIAHPSELPPDLQLRVLSRRSG
jgi:pimeloyl-ACP methyl ester carboxylesterase